MTNLYDLSPHTILELHKLHSIAEAAQKEAERAATAWVARLRSLCYDLQIDAELDQVAVDFLTAELQATTK